MIIVDIVAFLLSSALLVGSFFLLLILGAAIAICALILNPNPKNKNR